MSAPERSWRGEGSADGSPLSSLKGRASAEREMVGGCEHCCTYRAFRREDPSTIEASDRVEYAVHLIVRHGFVR